MRVSAWQCFFIISTRRWLTKRSANFPVWVGATARKSAAKPSARCSKFFLRLLTRNSDAQLLELAMPFYKLLLDNVPEPFAVVADSAFRLSKHLRGRVYTPLKEDKLRSLERRAMPAASASANSESTRQSRELARPQNGTSLDSRNIWQIENAHVNRCRQAQRLAECLHVALQFSGASHWHGSNQDRV